MIYFQEQRDTLQILQSKFIENYGDDGGALYIFIPDFLIPGLISNCVFMSNSVGNNGGAIYFYQDIGNIIILIHTNI